MEKNNQAIQSFQTSNFVNNQPQVKLFLFTQRMIPDQYRRPHIYNFDGQFRIDLQENIDRGLRGGAYTHLNTLMPESMPSKHAILPSVNSEHINLKSFGDMWTFILVIDNGTAPSPLGTRSFPGRSIFSGWVTDEPVNTVNFGGGIVPNPNAVFSITHNTHITCPISFTSSGMVPRPDVNADYDYVSGTILQQIQNNGQTLYSIDPKRITNGLIPDSENGYPSSTASIAPTPISAGRFSTEINTDINNPLQHLGTIVGSIYDSVKMSKENNNPADIMDSFTNETIISSMANLMNPGLNVSAPIDPKVPFTFQELLMKFNNDVDVVVCKQPYDIQYELSCAATPSRRNVFTSLFSTSIPPILAGCNLAEVAFRYNSYEKPIGGLGSVGNDRGIFHLWNIASLFQVPQELLNSYWDNFQFQLRNTLFPMVLSNGGHFDLTMHCSLAGVSLINLVMLDELPEQGLIETNNLLGGLNTPLVASQDVVTNNSLQLLNVVRDVTNANSCMQQQFYGENDFAFPTY